MTEDASLSPAQIMTRAPQTLDQAIVFLSNAERSYGRASVYHDHTVYRGRERDRAEIYLREIVAARDAVHAQALAVATKRAEDAEAQCERMREALEPFGDISGDGDEDCPDETPVVVKFGRTTDYALKIGDLRRARAALADSEEAEHG